MSLQIIEHKSSSYAPRTYVNACADVTAAFAVDHNTAGERLTQTAAMDRIFKVQLLAAELAQDNPVSWSRGIYRLALERRAKTLNVAGNSIYTFHHYRWTQEAVNQYVYDVLQPIIEHTDIKEIFTGGQTGADIAGAIAGVALGIDVIVTMPKGFKQRHEDGIDVNHTREEIIQQIMDGVEGIRL